MTESLISRGFRGRRQSGTTAGRLPPGQYTLSCDVSVNGATEAATVLTSAAVQSVTLDGADILLNLAGGSQIPFSQVTEIL